MKKQISILLLTILFSISGIFAGEIWVLDVEGVINPVSNSYITQNISKAQDKDIECIIINLDTPGGLMTSMREIIKEILNSNIPIIVYVSPSGAQSASAGVFITVSAHIAAMAPGTNIGAAHPVNLSGGIGGSRPDSSNSKTMMEKVTNDAVAYIRSIAQERNRNEQWLEQAVRKSVSITETEALEKNIIDTIVVDQKELIDYLDGKTVIINSEEITINTKNQKIINKPPGVHRKILNIISDPNISYILLMLGFYGVLFEIKNPGAMVPGIVGGICLILAFFSFQVLPINYAGLALIIVGIILFILEVSITSFGLLTIGGIISMLFGSMMLIDYSEAPQALFSISLKVIIPFVLFTAVFIILALTMALKTYKSKVTTGAEGIIGEFGEVIHDISPEKTGKVLVHGEIWLAASNQNINKGDEITVISVVKNKMKLNVEKSN